MSFASPAAKERTVPWEFTASPAWPAPTRRTRFTATRATPARSARQTARRVVRRVRPDGINPRPVSWSASVASPAGSLRSLGKLRATGATRARTARPPARRPASTARPGGFSPSRVGANANSARRGDLPRVPPHAAAACNSARGARAPLVLVEQDSATRRRGGWSRMRFEFLLRRWGKSESVHPDQPQLAVQPPPVRRAVLD